MKISKSLAFIASVALLTTSSAAVAAGSCSGPAYGVAIEVNGDVLVESIGTVHWPRLCNVRTPMNGVTIEACKMMYASLLTAQASGKSVTMWISDTTTTCTTLTPWRFVNGFYFLRVDG